LVEQAERVDSNLPYTLLPPSLREGHQHKDTYNK
jgi:hypothetical protein